MFISIIFICDFFSFIVCDMNVCVTGQRHMRRVSSGQTYRSTADMFMENKASQNDLF